MRILHLTVTKEWFDKILSGEKKEDFREIKTYWLNRFKDRLPNNELYYRQFNRLIIKNGYAKNAPTIITECTGVRITGPDEQTDLGVGQYFAIGIKFPFLFTLNIDNEHKTNEHSRR